MSILKCVEYHYNTIIYSKSNEHLNKFFLILNRVFNDFHLIINDLNTTTELKDFFIKKKLIKSSIDYESAFNIWRMMYPLLIKYLLDP